MPVPSAAGSSAGWSVVATPVPGSDGAGASEVLGRRLLLLGAAGAAAAAFHVCLRPVSDRLDLVDQRRAVGARAFGVQRGPRASRVLTDPLEHLGHGALRHLLL
jgi:hypothetical protein